MENSFNNKFIRFLTWSGVGFYLFLFLISVTAFICVISNPEYHCTLGTMFFFILSGSILFAYFVINFIDVLKKEFYRISDDSDNTNEQQIQ